MNRLGIGGMGTVHAAPAQDVNRLAVKAEALAGVGTHEARIHRIRASCHVSSGDRV